MTNEQIKQFAEQAGLVRVGDGWSEPARWGISEITRFAELVRNAALDDAIIFCADHGVSWITIEAMMEKLKS